MKNCTIGIFFTILIFSFSSFGQNSLNDKYQNLLERTETFKEYKVIPKTSLDDLWKEVADTLRVTNATIGSLGREISSEQAKVAELSANLTSVQSQLDESLNLNDTIHFVGIPFSKFGYHLMVWLIIAGLVVVSLISYSMFMRSNRHTVKHKKELEQLGAAYEDHKVKARETQIKLKRELQTAINALEERRKTWN